MKEFLVAKIQFRKDLVRKNPGHPHLAVIDADIAQHQATIDLLNAPPQAAQSSRPEEAKTRLSKEARRLVEHMRGDGYAVYKTSGVIPAQIKREDMKFWFLNPGLENLSSEPALLAFKPNPQDFFLRGSHNIPHEDMLELLEEERKRVEREYPGAGLITREGQAPEWIELPLRHFNATDRRTRLFGRDFGYNYTWTDTYENGQPGARRALVGDWYEAGGLNAFFWRPGYVGPDLRLAPLVEIPRK